MFEWKRIYVWPADKDFNEFITRTKISHSQKRVLNDFNLYTIIYKLLSPDLVNFS